MPRFVAAAALVALCSALALPLASASRTEYDLHDDVALIASKVGPYSNPSETYSYYRLPFCEKDEDAEHQAHTIGEHFSGDRKIKTGYQIDFQVDVPWRRLCERTLSAKDIASFVKAVDEEYYFEMYLDGLPIWGYIGDSDKESELFLTRGIVADPHKYIYTHLHFNIAYNGNNIIAVNVTANPLQRLDITGEDGATPSSLHTEFTYSVKWEATGVAHKDRMTRYHHAALPASYEIHWLSIINSFVLVVMLTAFLAIILMRVLRNDFTRYMQADVEKDASDLLPEEDSGWKLVHGDVFRVPPHVMLFCATIGAGTQLIAMVLLVLGLALLSVFQPTQRGALATASMIMYALTAGLGGYTSAKLYRQLGGTNWVWNVVLCAVMFPGPLFVAFAFLNSVAISHDSSAALPFATIMMIFAVYLFVTFPLTVMGGIMGRNTVADFDAPCRTNKVPRQIPEAPWYRQGAIMMFMAGFLPFTAIYIELHYIFASVWGHKIYTLFGILFLAFVLLIIVTSFITIALTYFQLALEDHRWWWRSFTSGGSTGLFVYAYSFFYYYERTEMSGFMQTAFYFGYMAVVSYGFFMLLGTVGFFSALIFVRHIYRAIKCD